MHSGFHAIEPYKKVARKPSNKTLEDKVTNALNLTASKWTEYETYYQC